jgi:hypothetical protein
MRLKILKHLDLWEIDSRPKAFANTSHGEPFSAYGDPQGPIAMAKCSLTSSPLSDT